MRSQRSGFLSRRGLVLKWLVPAAVVGAGTWCVSNRVVDERHAGAPVRAAGAFWSAHAKNGQAKTVVPPVRGLELLPGETVRLAEEERGGRTFHRLAFRAEKFGGQSGFLALTLREKGPSKVRLTLLPAAETAVELTRLEPGGVSRRLARETVRLRDPAAFDLVVTWHDASIEVALDGAVAMTAEIEHPAEGRTTLWSDGVRLRQMAVHGRERGEEFDRTEEFAALATAPAGRRTGTTLLAALVAWLAAAVWLRAFCLGRPPAVDLARAALTLLAGPAAVLVVAHVRPLAPLPLGVALGVAAVLAVFPALFVLRGDLKTARPLGRLGAARVTALVLLYGGLATWGAAAARGHQVRAWLDDADRALATLRVEPFALAGPVTLDLASAVVVPGPLRSFDLTASVEIGPDAVLEVRCRSGEPIAQGIALIASTGAAGSGFVLESDGEFRPIGRPGEAVTPSVRHSLALQARGESFDALLDGRALASATEFAMAAGDVVLVAPRGAVRIENLRVEPSVPEPPVPALGPMQRRAAWWPMLGLVLLAVGAGALLAVPASRAVEIAAVALLPVAIGALRIGDSGTWEVAWFWGLSAGAGITLLLFAMFHGRGARATLFVLLALAWPAFVASRVAPWPAPDGEDGGPGYDALRAPVVTPGLLHFQHPLLRRLNTWLVDHRFRDRRFTLARPAGTRRVLCLGSSSTWGHGISTASGGDYPTQLEALLRERSPGSAIEVINGAVRGSTTARLMPFFEEVLLRFDPDVVTVSFYFNDAHHLTQMEEARFLAEVAERGTYGLLDRISTRVEATAGKQRLSALFSRFHRDGPDCASHWDGIAPSTSSPAVRFAENLRRYAERCREHGAALVLIQEPVRGDVDWIWKREFRAAMLRVGSEVGAPVVDPTPALRERGADPLFMDLIHPLPAGNRIIAEALAPVVEEALDEP